MPILDELKKKANGKADSANNIAEAIAQMNFSEGGVTPEEIAESVSAYLDEHLTNPTNPPVDTSLAIAGAAADAKETGDKITQLKEDLGYNVTFTPEIERASINATTGKNTSDAYTAYYRTGGFYRPKHIKAISSRGYLNTWIYFYASDDVNTYISRSVAYSDLDADVEYPDGANYVRITGQVSNDPDNPIDLTAITVVMTPILEDVNTRLDTLEANQTDIGALSQKVTANADNIKNVRTLDVLRNYPICDHLFVNKTGNNIVIPSESIYHVRISRRLGYRVMELNTRVTSDGVLFVHHLANGKFGQYFHHVDGETDIANIMANTVTWQWILDNVRYNSHIERFRTAPSTLETMLRECKQQNIIPLVERVGNALQVADEIMGKDNYIAHGATREQAPTATIIRWNQTLTTKQDIVDYCDAIGTPLIYAIGNPTSFTDEQLADITATLHDKGYMMGTSYNDYWWYKYRRFGFDFDSAQMLMNRIECGNICNYQSIFGYNNFTYTNANVANGELTYTAGGTLSPNIDSTVYQLSGFDLEIVYNGRITFPQVGEFNGVTINSDGATPIYLSVPIINGSPKITLTVAKDTVIKDVKFSASVF